MKWALLILTLACFTLFTWGCRQESIQNRASIEKNGVDYYLETDKRSYGLGESVNILYRVTNKADEVEDLGTVYNCKYCIRQLKITLGDNEIWRTCRVPPPCGQKEFRLNPHESWEYTEAWSMVNDNGTLEPDDDFPIGDKGIYKVTGKLQNEEVSVTIERK